MLRKIALEILSKIVEMDSYVTEIRLTEAKEAVYTSGEQEYDVVISESCLSHSQLQALDELLANYDAVEMEADFYNKELRIFEAEEEGA